jgi:mannose-6-phosphate isomerase
MGNIPPAPKTPLLIIPISTEIYSKVHLNRLEIRYTTYMNTEHNIPELPFTEERPWGFFRQFTQNENSTVKILSVNPGQLLSLQSHTDRTEFWHVLSGHPTLQRGEEIITVSPGDEIIIPAGTQHRISVKESQVTPVILLEIATGHFDENDITRYEDIYGRNDL